MKILFLGDLVGRVGRDAVVSALADLRDEFEIDCVVVNVENAAGGFGITQKIADQVLEAGADALTLGNHAFDQREILSVLDNEPRIIKPLNWPRTPGRGARVIRVRDGRKVLVVNVLGRVFMNPADDPFAAVDAILRAFPLGSAVAATVIDMHAEATSEKMAMGHWCDGRASLVVGTHTHIPTADAHILAGGTGYMSDVGMCGDYDSVVGMEKTQPLKKFITGLSARYEPAKGEATICGVVVEIDDATGLAVSITPLRRGGCLQSTVPD